MDYSIGEFSKRTGLGIHTLRYYEHENLISPKRNSSNRRRYSDEDLAWVAFIRRLKDTAMPIQEIKRYAALRAAGDSTLNERLEMLLLHRQVLKENIAQLQAHQIRLDAKIDFYQAEIKRIQPPD